MRLPPQQPHGYARWLHYSRISFILYKELFALFIFIFTWYRIIFKRLCCLLGYRLTAIQHKPYQMLDFPWALLCNIIYLFMNRARMRLAEKTEVEVVSEQLTYWTALGRKIFAIFCRATFDWWMSCWVAPFKLQHSQFVPKWCSTMEGMSFRFVHSSQNAGFGCTSHRGSFLFLCDHRDQILLTLILKNR